MQGMAQSAWALSLGASLPGVNATFNATSAVLLLLAYIAVRKRRYTLHSRLMLAALTSSAASGAPAATARAAAVAMA